jgi:hypothetical protein
MYLALRYSAYTSTRRGDGAVPLLIEQPFPFGTEE